MGRTTVQLEARSAPLRAGARSPISRRRLWRTYPRMRRTGILWQSRSPKKWRRTLRSTRRPWTRPDGQAECSAGGVADRVAGERLGESALELVLRVFHHFFSGRVRALFPRIVAEGLSSDFSSEFFVVTKSPRP